jgi:hypothetical protein
LNWPVEDPAMGGRTRLRDFNESGVVRQLSIEH